MNDDYFLWWFFGGIVALLLIVVGGTFWAESASCHAQAERMGFPATWGPLQSCMIEVEPGHWIPGTSYRYFTEEQP